jgi:hypothetical protein
MPHLVECNGLRCPADSGGETIVIHKKYRVKRRRRSRDLARYLSGAHTTLQVASFVLEGTVRTNPVTLLIEAVNRSGGRRRRRRKGITRHTDTHTQIFTPTH